MVETLSITVNRENGKRRWTSFALVALLVTEVYLLIGDISFLGEGGRAPSGASGAPIAELVKHRNVVRTQAAGDLVWEDTSDGQTLFRKQNVLTMEGARAEIAFLDGTGLVLDENSLIQLEKNPGDDSSGYQRIVVKLLRGSIHKREPRRKSELLAKHGATPELEIRVGDVSAMISPSSELTVVANPELGGQFQVTSGEISLDAGGSKVSVGAGEVASIAKAGAAPVKQKMDATLFGPRAGESVPSGAPVALRWKGESSGWTVELARDAAFTKAVARHPAGSASEIELTPQTGAWHWRVVGNDGEASLPGHFVVEAPARPELRSPADGIRIAQDTAFDLLWSPVQDAIGYEVEITLDGASERKLNARVSATTVPGLSAGDHEWRVRAKLRDGTATEWSEPRSVRSIDSESDSPPSPPPPPGGHEAPEFEPGASRETWIARAIRAFGDALLASAQAAEDSSKTWNIRLRWGAVDGAKKYRLQLSRKATFDKLIVQTETDAPAWTWQYQVGMENSKGRVFYRVASVSAKGEVGAFSDPIPIQVPESILAAARAMQAPTAMSNGEPVAAPAPIPVGDPPTDQPEATITTEVAPPAPGARYEFGLLAAVQAGVGSASQSSDDKGIKSVSLDSPYFQERFSAAFHLERSVEDRSQSWTSVMHAAFTRFDDPGVGREILQEEFSAYAFRSDTMKWIEPRHGWKLAVGGVLERDYRWIKDGSQSVTSQGGWSLGPVAYAVRNFESKYPARPVEIGVSLALPLSGVATGGHFGMAASAWGESKLFSLGKTAWIGLRAEAGAKYSRWSTPEGTGTLTWNVWLAPTIHLGSEPGQRPL